MATRCASPPDNSRGRACGARFDAQLPQQVARGLLGGVVPGGMNVHRGEAHVLQRRHVLEQMVELKHEPDAAAQTMQHRAIGSVAAVEPRIADFDCPARKRIEPGDRAQDRRLAAARRPAQRNQIAGPRFEREIRHQRAPAAGQVTSRRASAISPCIPASQRSGVDGVIAPTAVRAAAPAPPAAATSRDTAARRPRPESPSSPGWSRRSASAWLARRPSARKRATSP